MICNKCGTNCNDSEKFCHTCGSALISQATSINYQNQVVYNNTNEQPGYQNNVNNQNNGISNKILYMISGVIIITTIIVTILIVNSGNNDVYFDEHRRIEPEETGEIRNNGITSIKTDNIYYLNINNVAEAKKQISDDSTNQKGNCDKKIIEIENRIIKIME